MFKLIKFFIKKYILSNRREWLRFDSIFMVIGIIISVATLTIALAIFEGYENVLKDTILGANSHVYVFLASEGNLNSDNLQELKDILDEQEEVASYSPIIMTQAMASANGRIEGSVVRGIAWQKEELPTSYKEKVFAGNYELKGENSAVIGFKLAKELNLEIGDEFELISPINSSYTPMGMKSQKETFKIVGLYKSGMHEYDTKYIFLDFDVAAEFASMQDEFTMMEIKLTPDDIERADYLAYKWRLMLDYKYQITSWIHFNGNLFSLLKLEKWVIYIILSFLILIASFNVVSTVSTSIIEKKRELGILKAYGASDSLLQKIFVGRTLFIAIIAVTLGQITGFVISKILSWQSFFLLKGDVYFLEKINVSFDPISWIMILGTSMIIITLTSFFPLRKISKMEITDILRSRN
ncbi:MAG: ABC transporter permease [Candidatus Cloacimonetes bacterium]|nr:ABC transporter permease [Candidatus Cloacimonadota bacterium]MCF7812925.1 ABC transporter permease [Candidatus Cloacimonadota bacterium]MCF7867137.1 ABC transporter permease [Candidatus Cloacimonadota bacterium]MCF7882543.1 ABC transporter permease [Candidatus Cloacimonadota bacterium]